MTINVRNSSTLGQTQTGIVVLLFGNQVGNNALVQRSTSPSGPWEDVAEVADIEESGTPFFDYLPLDGITYYYRAKAIERGFEDSDFTDVVSAEATLIPTIDWLAKPWLYDSSIPLQLQMDIVSETSSSVIVSASKNIDPVGIGTPTVSVESSYNIPAVVSSGSLWVITRPVSGSGRVTFRNTLAGRLGDTDSIDVVTTNASQFYQLQMTIVSSSADSITVSGSLVDTFGQSYNISILNSKNVSPIQLSPAVWQMLRPSDNNVEGTVTFLVTGSAAVQDTDTIYVTKDNLISPTVRTTVTNTTDTSLTASLRITDPYAGTGSLSGFTIAVTSQSLAGFSVTQSSQTNTGGVLTTVYNITKPQYGQGTGRVTWTVNKTGYAPDSDSVDVPERVDGLAKLRTVVSPQGSTGTQQIVSVRVTDSIMLTGSYIALSSSLLGIPSISPTGSFLLSASEARNFTIERPAYGQGIGRVTFTATAAGRVSDSDAVDISERDISSVSSDAATITVGTVTSGSTEIRIPFTFGSASTAQTVYVYTKESTTDIPLISVESTGDILASSPIIRGDGRTSVTVPIAIAGNTVVTTFVPFDNLNRRGQITNVKAVALTSSLTPPSAFGTTTILASGSTFVSASVQMPASNLPDTIRTYRNGSQYGVDVTRTAGASTSQTVIVTGLSPNTTYSIQFSGVKTNGAESSLSTPALLFTTTGGGTLPTTEVSFGVWENVGGGQGLLYFYVDNADVYPTGTTFEGELYVNPGSTLVGSFEPTTLTTLTFPYTGPGIATGTATFRAKANGYTTSTDQTGVQWNNAEPSL